MTDPNKPHSDPEQSDLDESALDRALDGAFGAAGDAANREAPAPTPSVIERIGEVTGSKPNVSLRDAEEGQTPMLKPLGPDDSRDAGKYMVQGELGRGGVGAVHKGHDQDLGRDVAMKFLHEKYRDHPDILHRFVEEAQIGGQLQHPGIVPVYDLGMSDGKPFFTMKLVKGKTLAQALSERESVADDRRRFLAIFEQICQTMAYAHVRGVVHRDLKPANIMIGSFGEVQVVDWGMGKVLERGGVADEKRAAEKQPNMSVIETVRSSGHGTQSVMGSVMGTPAYMPPEQALGNVERMDERSDVFALGAILCEMLTGLPPYVGNHNELIAMAAMAKLDDAHARLKECGAGDDIVELAKRCLMPASESRPQSAEDVAKAVHEHLGAAERRAHEANVRAAALKRTQKLGIALAGVFAAGLATSLWFWQAAAESAASEKRAAQNEKTARQQADTARDAAQSNLDNFNRLSHVVRLEAARALEDDLHPAWPTKSDAMRSWLDTDAGGLTDALPELRATLATLEERATPQPDEDQAEGRPRTTWHFEDGADGFLHSTLRQLVADIEAFDQREVAAVRQRLAWSEQVEELTLTRYREKWNTARSAILRANDITASELYREAPVDLAPQMGLIPLGMNPVTKLWEFYHLRSAWDGTSDPAELEIPNHNEDGSIDVTADTGIVFVLLPGDTFWMGAQKSDPSKPNYDEHAGADETPREVEVAPFFLARHELTQGQWARLWSGDPSMRRPSSYGLGFRGAGMPAPVSDAHPVEQVDWRMSDEIMVRHGLTLPTEAQWEHGCRGTTDTPYWVDFANLKEFSNLADATAKRAGVPWTCESWTDGHIVHAPAGTFGANPFGLHNVHGNVSEWCKNLYGGSSPLHVFRGGSFTGPAAIARSAHRSSATPALRTNILGLRPARLLSE